MANTTNQKYKETHYDQLLIRVKKGKREEYQRAASDFGMSFRELIQTSVEKFIAERSLQDYCPPITSELKPASSPEKLTLEERKILDAVEALPPTARKLLLKFIQELAVNQRREGDPN